MSDYKIQIGTILDTSGIDQKVKNYKGNVEVGSTLDTSGITKILNAYKANPLNINTKLSTKGITKAIRAYNPPKMIHLESDLNTVGIDNKINNYIAPKPIRVDVELTKSSINQQIRNANPTEYITVNAKLDDNAISKAIRDYTASEQIKLKVDVDPQFDNAAAKISGYQMRNMLTVNVKLNKTAIDSQIKNYQASKYIEVGAKLRDNAIENAITKYTAKELVPITIDFKVGDNKEVSQKISEYKNTPVEVPVKLMPAKTGFSDKITNTPVKVSATVDKDDIRKDIETAVGGYTPTAKMPVDIKLTMPKDINAQVTGLGKPTEKISVGVKLDELSINDDIGLFKPTATLGIQSDLILENIDDQIRAYVPKERIKVHLDLIDSDISAEAGKQKTQAPITVNVKLDPDGINKQIEDLKPTSRVKVGVQLDFASHKDKNTKEYIQKGISKQIKDYQTKTKIKLGVELDRDSIIREIEQINVGTPIILGIKFDPNGIKNVNDQIDSIRQKIQQIGNININLGGNRVSTGIGSNEGQDIQTVRIARGVDDVTRAYRELLSIQNRMGSKQQAVAKLDTNKNAHEILELSNQIDELAKKYQRIHQLFSGQFSSAQVDALNRNFEITAEKLSVIKSKALDAKDSLDKIGGSGNTSATNGASGSSKRQVDEVTQAYRDLMGVLRELDSKKLQLNRLTASSPQSSNEIQTLRLQIEQLGNEYDNLLRSFSAQGIQFSPDQWNQLETAMARVGRQIDVVQAKMSDKSAAQSQTQAYKELLSISKEIGSLETNIEKLRLQGGNTNQIEVLENQLRTLQSTYRQLVTTINTPLTEDQWSAIYTQIAKTSEEIEKLKAKYADTRAELAKKIKGNFSGYDAQVKTLETSIAKLSSATPEVANGFAQVKQALTDMKNAANNDDLIAAEERYQRVLKETFAQLKINQSAEEQGYYGDSLTTKKEAALQRLNSLFESGSQAAKKFGSRAQELRDELNRVGSTKGVEIVNQKIKNLGDEIKNSGLATKRFGTSLREQFARYKNYISIASVFMYAARAARSMFEQVKLIDSAMTELKKVTDETDAAYDKFLSNAASKAKEIGTTIDGLVSSTADFARLGYGFEESQKLAEVANIYAVVGDEIEGVEGATESLISTLAAFKSEASGISDADFAMDIIDIFNELGKLIA